MERRDFERIDPLLDGITSCAVAGHVHPDGDCVGAVSALYTYIRENYPEISAVLYLEEASPVFSAMPGISEALRTPSGVIPERLFLLDVSSPERVGAAADLAASVKDVVVIDHHISNRGFGSRNVIMPEASSACEVLYGLLDKEKIGASVAEALYTGIVHDTGVFRYSSTGPETLRAAAELLTYGIPFTKIIEKTFEERSYAETRILGFVMENAKLVLGGNVVLGTVTEEDMKRFGATALDLSAASAELRRVAGTAGAVFLYPDGKGSFKASMRSGELLDVSRAAGKLGGGGHVRAAGCTVDGPLEKAISTVLSVLEDALSEEGLL